jgi:two-component system NtrC family sensor kinase
MPPRRLPSPFWARFSLFHMDDKDNTNYYRSLTRNMVLITLVLALTPLFLVTGAIGYYFDISYREKVLDHLRMLVQKHKTAIDNFLNEKLSDIRVLSQCCPFEQFKDDEFLRTKLGLLRDEYRRAFIDLGVVDSNGIQIDYAGPLRLQGADYSQEPWFKEAIRRQEYVSDVFPGLRGTPHFIVAVTRESAGKRWLLRATVDFEAFNSLVENVRIGSTGFAYIINKQNELQTKHRLEIKLPPLDASKPAHDALWTQDEVESFKRFIDGDSYIYVVAPLKNGDWLLAFQQNEFDAFWVLHKARGLALVILFIGGAGILVGATVVSRRMVTRIARADREKELMNERVIEAGKLASLGELAAGIAHEINNPVAIMVEEAGWIEDIFEEEEFKDAKNIDEFRRSLSQIRTQGKRCKEITHKLLSFARKTDPALKRIQLNQVIDEVISLSEQRAKFSNVKMISKLDWAIPEIAVSPSEIQQVMLNLINNSVDAMEHSGGTIEIITSRSDEQITVEVRDNGPGIPKANLARVFDPFFTTKPVGRGTGLGLSICYGIIKKLGREITAQSVVGIGTTFRINIPLSRSVGADSGPGVVERENA